MKRAFEISTNDDDENDDVKAYLAMSSSDEDENVQSDKDDPEDIQIEDSSCFSNKEGEMEMKFATDEAKNTLESKEYNDRLEQNMAPWEKYLHKKKEKQKKKREARKLVNSKDDESFDSVKTETKKRKISKEDTTEERGNDLSLLVMDSDDDKQHFDYKDIIKKESKKAKKLRKKLERAKNEVEENFKVDLDDNRFSAVFQNADFNVDPSNPNFKATQSMLDIVAEKQKRAHKRNKGTKKDKTSKMHKIEDLEKASDEKFPITQVIIYSFAVPDYFSRNDSLMGEGILKILCNDSSY